jgi:hypothetical protein
MPPSDDAITPQPPAGGAASPPAPGPAATAGAPAAAPADPAEVFRRRVRLLDGALVAAVLLFAFAAALFPARNSDLLMNLAAGRLISQGEYRFGVDPFAFTTQGVYWANHSWLFGLLAYCVYQIPVVGGPALVVLKALLVVALAEVMLRLASRRGQSLWIPASCTALAVAALSPRVLLQPTVVSYLLLALTLYLLARPRREPAAAGGGRAGWDRRWLVPVLCALWVNVDAWFLLGPAVVGLFLLGELLSAQGPAGRARELKTLAAVLAASVAACLVNPHTYHAFTLPPQLGLTGAGPALRGDPYFGPFFSGVLGEALQRPGYGPRFATLAFYPLALAGLVSFGLAPEGVRGWRGAVWLGLFLLGAWNARAVPFFAVAAGPIASLNFLDYAAARPAAAAGARRRGGLAGRALTLAAGVLLVAAAATGWLQAQPDARRLGWDVEFDPALEEAARQVAAWRDRGQADPDGRWFNTGLEVNSYLAWFCPGQRGFLDPRFGLFGGCAEDYLKARRALTADLSEGELSAPPGRGDVGEVFARWNAGYLFHEVDPGYRQTRAVLARALAAPSEWGLSFLNGRAALFSWRDPDGRAAGPSRPLPPWDPDRVAFGPDPARAPAAPAAPAQPREWWDALWRPEPPRPAAIDEAAAQLYYFQAESPRAIRHNTEEARRRLRPASAAAAAAAPALAGPLPAVGAQLAAGRRDYLQGAERLYVLTQDDGPPAALYLALRAGRRALGADPAAPQAAQASTLVGQAYTFLQRVTRERVLSFPLFRDLRQVQQVAAFTQAVRLDPDQEPAHARLTELYDGRYLDLYVKHLKEQVRCQQEHAAEQAAQLGPEGAQAVQDQIRGLQERVARWEKVLADRRNVYENTAANKPVLQRVQAAMQNALPETALALLQKELREQTAVAARADDRTVGTVLEWQVRLLLATGRLDEARELLDPNVANLLGRMPGLPVPPDAAFDWYRAQLAAASGDYAGADQALQAVLSKMGRARLLPQEPEPTDAAVLFSGSFAAWFLQQLSQAAGRPLLDLRPVYSPAVRQQTLELLAVKADVEVLRAALALEAGDTEAAAAQLRHVLTWTGHRGGGARLGFAGAALADMFLNWLEANGAAAGRPEPAKD